MRTVREILESPGYDKEWLLGASKEVARFHREGLWPKAAPFTNQFRHALMMEGYPSNQVQNILLDSIALLCITEVSGEKSWKQ